MITVTSLPPIADDPLSAGVLESIRALVDGNGASRSDVEVRRLERSDRDVTLLLDVTMGWQSSHSSEPGGGHPQGSTSCANEAEAGERVKRTAEQAAADPAVAAELAARLRADPLDTFRSTPDTIKVCELPGRWHWHERCGRCSGKGRHHCTNLECRAGSVVCGTCRGDGKRPCASCGGRGNVQVEARNHHDGTMSYGTARCGACYGSGRSGYCYSACSAGWLWCPDCRGTTVVDCAPCDAQGLFLNRYEAWLTGGAKRSWRTEAEEPPGFVQAFKSLPLVDVPGPQAEIARTVVASVEGICRVRLDCRVPHVRAELVCRGVGIELDAVGKDAVVPGMPRFLDDLIVGSAGAMLDPDASPEDVIAASRRTRVTEEVLSAVRERGGWDAATVAGRHSGAVSPELLERLHQGVTTAYHRLGAGPIRRTWLVGGLLAAGLAVATAFLPLADWLLRHATDLDRARPALPVLVQLLGWGLPFLLIALTALVAGVMGRRAVRAVVGAGATRSPKQGRLPWVAMVAVLLAHGGGLALRASREAHPTGTESGRTAVQPPAPSPATTASPTAERRSSASPSPVSGRTLQERSR